MLFAVFMALFAIFLNFLRFLLFKHMASNRWRILNTKKEGSVKIIFFDFCRLMPFKAAKKWSYRFPWKTSSDCTTSLPDFTEFHQRKHQKIHCRFCSWNVDLSIKCRPTLTFSFERAEITWALVLSASPIVKLYGATSWDFRRRVFFLNFFHLYPWGWWKTKTNVCRWKYKSTMADFSPTVSFLWTNIKVGTPRCQELFCCFCFYLSLVLLLKECSWQDNQVWMREMWQ